MFHESMTTVSLICTANGNKYQSISIKVVKKPLIPYCKCWKMNYIDIDVATRDSFEDEERSVISNDTRSVPSMLLIHDSSGDLEADNSSSAAVVSGDMSKVG